MKRPALPLILALTIAAFVFLKNAWVTEDAYILFRSLDQLFAGNGPVWNPHERVQVFTSPLWYFLLAGFRAFSPNNYLNAILASALCWAAALLVLRRLLTDSTLLLAGVLVMVASNGFYDFTSSGLENPLAYLLISLYLLFTLRRDGDDPQARDRSARAALLCFGLALCVRHDLLTLLLPPTVFLLVDNRPGWSRRGRAGRLAVALVPLAVWTLFSLVYYGFPLPNSAYAKLDTGIPRLDMVRQGLLYLDASFRRDTITFLVIVAAVAVLIFRPAPNRLRALGAGLLLNLAYVVLVGGDFMQGRFLSYAFLVALVVLLLRFAPGGIPLAPSLRMTGIGLLAVYLIAYPHTPIGSAPGYGNPVLLHGVADERGFFSPYLTLLTYTTRQPDGEFPEHPFADEGRKMAATALADTAHVEGCIGMFAYFAGRDRVIIDPLGLTDPLLARLPALDGWRIGHYERTVPDGYTRRRLDGVTPLADPRLDAYYDRLEILTRQRPLLSRERLGVILRFNLGVYDDLVRPPKDR